MKTPALLSLLVYSTVAAEPTTQSRPNFVRTDVGLGAPEGVFGAAIGRAFHSDLTLELGFGLGLTGWQVALLGRHYLPVAGSDIHSFTFAAGLSVALAGAPVGNRIAHRADIPVSDSKLFYMAMLNAEVGYELRLRWGGIFRVALGGYVVLAENMSGLCDGVPQGRHEPISSCNPPHFPPGPLIAAHRVLPYLTVGYGWAW